MGRIIKELNLEKISVGNVILSSGEIPSLLITEAIVRQIKGVIGNDKSVHNDSIISGLLEHSLYTSPEEFKGEKVPEVLRSGNHKEIKRWKQKESLKETLFMRPDLLKTYKLK